jgi:hypothetical protein
VAHGTALCEVKQTATFRIKLGRTWRTLLHQAYQNSEHRASDTNRYKAQGGVWLYCRAICDEQWSHPDFEANFFSSQNVGKNLNFFCTEKGNAILSLNLGFGVVSPLEKNRFQLKEIKKNQITSLHKTNSVALVGEWTIPAGRPLLVGEVNANFCS